MALGRVFQGWYRILDFQDDPASLVYRSPHSGGAPYNDEGERNSSGIGNENSIRLTVFTGNSSRLHAISRPSLLPDDLEPDLEFPLPPVAPPNVHGVHPQILAANRLQECVATPSQIPSMPFPNAGYIREVHVNNVGGDYIDHRQVHHFYGPGRGPMFELEDRQRELSYLQVAGSSLCTNPNVDTSSPGPAEKRGFARCCVVFGSSSICSPLPP